MNENIEAVEVEIEETETVEDFGPVVETETTSTFSSFELRAIREAKNFSRQDVVAATGLSLSVVWRSEQEDKTISSEIYWVLVNFYENTPDKVITKKATKSSVTVVPCDHASLKNGLDDLALFIIALRDVAKDKKQGIAPYNEILNKLAEVQTVE